MKHWVPGDRARELEVTYVSIASDVCSFYPSSCLNIDSSPLLQGRRTFDITLNYPPSRFLRRPATLLFGPGTFTRSTASVPIDAIIVACPEVDLIDGNPDLVDAVVFRMGGG